MGLCASDPRSVFPWNILRGARLPVFIFYNYGFNIWISLYVLAPQLCPYLRIPIRTGKKILFLVLMVSEQGQKSGCLQPRGAEGGTSLTGVHCITGGAGNSCSFMLGVPNARKRKKKEQPNSTLNSVPTFRSPPFSFLPHTQDHTLALAPPGMHVCLPTQRRLPISSPFCLSFKEKRPKRNPGSWVEQPPHHRARPHRAARGLGKEGLLNSLGKWPKGFIGRSS